MKRNPNNTPPARRNLSRVVLPERCLRRPCLQSFQIKRPHTRNECPHDSTNAGANDDELMAFLKSASIHQ